MRWVPALSVEHSGRKAGGTSGAHGALTWPAAVRAGNRKWGDSRLGLPHGRADNQDPRNLPKCSFSMTIKSVNVH